MDKTKIMDIILSDATLLTCDRINALKGGHGGLNIAFLNAANRIMKALLAGHDASLQNANVPDLPVDELVKLGVEAAMEAGATPSNAALLTALLLYFTGTGARAGVPAANRKLGALARMHAGAERAGVAILPSPKMGNKVSGFPAVQALYEAMMRKELTRVDGGLLPFGAAGGTPWGHNALGEDIIIPEIAINGARIATQAMKRAYEGMGMPSSPIICAIFGAAAVAEVIHADAAVGEKYGVYGEVDSMYMAGLSAVQEAGLVRELHVWASNRKLDTARVVGDLGLILKDVGAPTVVGMIAFNDFLCGFMESNFIMPNAIGSVNPPIAHVPTHYLLATMDLLLHYKGDVNEVGESVQMIPKMQSLDPEIALASMYIITQKATELTTGPVTDALLAASEGSIREAILRRIKKTQEAFEKGKDITEVVRELESERKEGVEKRTGQIFSFMTGQKISLRFTEIKPQARRSDTFTQQYLGFDAYFDAEVKINKKIRQIKNLYGKALPNVTRGKLNRLKRHTMIKMGQSMARRGRMSNVQPGQEWTIPHMLDLPLSAALMASQELSYSSNCLLNVIVPTAVAVAMKKYDAQQASKKARKAAYITATVIGASSRARKVGEKIEENLASM